MPDSADEQEEVSILEKILKILIVVLGLSMLYSYVEPIVSEVTANAQRDRVTGDFETIRKAIERLQITGKKYTETSLQGLVDKKFIENLPKDPWGSEYVYNWYFDELVSLGPNRQLDTFVPGLQNEATSPESDDRHKSVAPMSKLVYFQNANGVGQIMKADLDGGGLQPVEEVSGEIQGLSILSNSKSIVYSLKRPSGYDLRILDFGTGERADLTNDQAADVNPCWASLKSDYIVFQSDRESPGSPGVFGMQLPAKTVQPLVPKASDEPAPAAAVAERRQIFFTAGTADRPSIQSITLPEVQPVEVVSGRGPVLHPSPSPNGAYLAFLVQQAQGASVEVIEIKTKKQLFKKDGASPKGFIAWSPESDKIAYQIPDKGQGKLVIAEPLTGRSFVHPQFVMALGRFAWIK